METKPIAAPNLSLQDDEWLDASMWTLLAFHSGQKQKAKKLESLGFLLTKYFYDTLGDEGINVQSKIIV